MQLSDRIGRRIKLHDLHVLMAVVQTGSMGKAAALLNTTQSAVSRSIAELEQTIGVRLLDRHAQGVELTHYGRALLKRGTVAFDELKQGVQDIEFLANPGTGELFIGSSSAVSEGIVLTVIDKLFHQYPRATFHLLPIGLPTLYDELRERRIDLGFARIDEPALKPDDVHQEPLFDDQLIVVASSDNPWTRRRKIRLAELLNEPWTWPTAGTTLDKLIVQAFRANGLEAPRPTVYAADINARLRLAATGRFLAVVPANNLRFFTKHESIKMLPVEFSTSYRRIGIITLKNRTLSPLAQLFIKCAHETAKPFARARHGHSVRRPLSKVS